MLDQVFEALREPVIVFDASGRPIRINRAAYDLVGLTPRTLSADDYLVLLRRLHARTLEGVPLTPQDLPSRHVLAGEGVAQSTFVLSTADGREIFVEATATPVVQRGGQVAAAVVVLRDITETRHAEAKLQRLVRTLRAHSHTDSAALRASDESSYLAEVCRIIVEDCQYPMVWVGLAEHDEAHTVRPAAFAGFDEGYVAQLDVTWADTERGRGPTGTAIRTGRVCECPDMMSDPGFAPWREQARQRGYASSVALPLASGGEVLGALTIYFTQRRALSSDELALLRDLALDIADGVRVLRLRTAEAEAREALRRQADELERADRVKDEFLATLSHELRTPLSTILVWAHLLLHADLDEEAHRRAEEAIFRNAEAQRALINDILDVSRIVSGKLRLEAGEVVFREVVTDAVEVVRPTADAKRLTLIVDADDETVVTGDAARLQQVVWNIVSNAVKFTAEGGTVAVMLDRWGSQVRLRVTDTGVGIAPAFLPHIFERFTQQDSSASRQHGGLGLGLAIVRHLVELHGGTVTAASEGEGFGATITVTLPSREERVLAASAQEPAGGTAPAAEMEGLVGIRILAVDDDADARELLATVLGVLQAEVVVVASAQEALALLLDDSFDILLADLSMPGMDGYGLIEAVRAMPGDAGRIPAIAVTAFGRRQDRGRALAAGYQAHVTKPVLPDQLAAAIAWFVAQRKNTGPR